MITLFDPIAHPLEGVTLLEASAGTGKTYNLATLVLRLVVERDLLPHQILLVTFTEAAASELKVKVEQRLMSAIAHLESGAPVDEVTATLLARFGNNNIARQRLNRALDQFDRAAIFTIHGYCHRLLSENPLALTDAPFPLVPDDGPIILDVVRDLLVEMFWSAEPFEVNALQQLGVRESRMMAIARQMAARPDLEVTWPAETEDVFGAYQASFNTLRELFDEPAIRAAVEGIAGLNRHSYSKRTLPSWLAQTAALLSEPKITAPVNPAHPLFRFSATTLQAASAGVLPNHPFFLAVDQLRALGDKLWHELALFDRRFVAKVGARLARHKRDEQVLFFDDLLLLARQMSQQDIWPSAIGAVLIDEFQDTDQVQYEVFARLQRRFGVPMVLVGDPKQAIYSFRGGDIFTYMEAARQADDICALGTNWRSDPGVINSVNQIFNRCEHPFVFKQIEFAPVSACPERQNQWSMDGAVSPAVTFLRIDGREDGGEEKLFPVSDGMNWRAMVFDIKQMLARGRIGERPVTTGDIAVLVRTNDQARDACAALTQAGITAVTSSETNLLESVAAADLYTVLCAMASAGDRRLLAAALSTTLFGFRGERWLESPDEPIPAELLARFALLARQGEGGRLPLLLQSLLAFEVTLGDGGARGRLLKTGADRQYLLEFEQMASWLVTSIPGATLSASLRFLERALSAPREVTALPEPVGGEVDGVQVVTIHKSKGLQYKVVVLPAPFWTDPPSKEGTWLLYHDPEDGFAQKCDPTGRNSAAVAQWKKESGAEQRRLLYVALTRAECAMRIIYCPMRGVEASALWQLLAAGAKRDLGIETDDVDLLLAAAVTACGGDAQVIRMAADSLRSFDGDKPGQVEKTTSETGTWAVRPWPQVAGMAEWVTSFSELVAGHERESTVHSDLFAFEELSDEPVQTGEKPQLPAAELMAGPDFGTMVHEVFEVIDFQAPVGPVAQQQVTAAIARNGLKGQVTVGDVLGLVEATCTASLGVGGALVELDKTQIWKEVPFFYPAGRSGRVNPLSLAEAMAVEASGVYAAYPASVARLGFDGVNGFLTGFIDLVFRHNGQWFIADYKTNRLGAALDDYDSDRIAADMAHHHYYLQAHLYLLALHRQLKRTIPGYDYDRDVGGGLYLYVRAIGTGRGIYFDKPPKARIEALDDLFRSQEG